MAAVQVCNRPFGSDVCPFHLENKVIFECVDCVGTLVCSKCIISEHNRHSFREIKSAVKEKMMNISSFITSSKTRTLRELIEEMKDTKRKLEKNNEAFDDEITQVKQHGEKLKAQVDLDTTLKVSRLEFLLKQNKEMFEKHQSVLEKLQTQIQEKINELQQTLKTGTDVLVYDTATRVMQTSSMEIPLFSAAVVTATFNPSQEYISFIHNAFGDVKEMRSTEILLDQPETLYDVKVNFRMRKNGMCPTEDNMAWCVYDVNRLYLVDNNGSVKRNLKLDVKIADISTHPLDGNIYCSCTRDKSVRSLDTKNGRTTVVFNIEETPEGLACMKNDLFVVSFEDEESVKVGLYTRMGKRLLSYKVQGSIVPGVSVCPQTNKTALFCGSNGLVVVDGSFQELYSYTGPPGLFGRCDCTTGVFCDKYLLVGDYSNMMIHILSATTTANYIKTIQTYNMSHVTALGVQQHDVLLVGCTDPNKLLCIKYLK